MIQQELVPKLVRDKCGIFKGKGEAGTQQICMLMFRHRGGGGGAGKLGLNVLTISKEKVSPLVDNTNVVSVPVIASALMKKKKKIGINVKGEGHSKKRIFFVIANKNFILS